MDATEIGTIAVLGSGEATVSDVDLVVEALAEDLPLKQEFFKQLDELCPPRTILASTTSTLDGERRRVAHALMEIARWDTADAG